MAKALAGTPRRAALLGLTKFFAASPLVDLGRLHLSYPPFWSREWGPPQHTRAIISD